MSTRTTCKPTPLIAPPTGRPETELRPLSLRKNFAWTLTGTGIYMVCQWGWVSLLAKMESREMVGRLGLALAITAPVVMFTRLQLRNIQATDARHEYRFSDYLSLRLVSTVVGMVIIGLVALSGSRFAHYTSADIMAVLAFGLMRAAEGFSEVIYGLLQKWERLDLQARSLMLKGPASLVALAVMMRLTHNLAWGALGIMVAWTVLMLAYDLPNARRIMRFHAIEEDLGLASLRPQRIAVLRQLAWLSLPMGFVALLDSLNTNVPRLVIQGHLGNDGLGYYTAMAAIVVAGNMVVASLAVSAAPRLSRDYLHDLRRFKRLVWKLVQFGIVLGGAAVIVAAALGRPLLTLLYRPEYARQLDVFVWIMIAAGLGYVARFLVYSMTAARYLRAQTPLYALSLTVVGVLSLLLVPAHGLRGAAWASVAGSIVLLLGAAAVNLYAVRARSRVLTQVEPLPDLPVDLV